QSKYSSLSNDFIHIIYVIRHGLYFMSTDKNTSHLTKFGEKQTRSIVPLLLDDLKQYSDAIVNPIQRYTSIILRAIETEQVLHRQLVRLTRNDLKFSINATQKTYLVETNKVHLIPTKFQDFYFDIITKRIYPQSKSQFSIVICHGNVMVGFRQIIQNSTKYNFKQSQMVQIKVQPMDVPHTGIMGMKR
ncbi:unnamed protein product, partial [Didymodactylos carnosus]